MQTDSDHTYFHRREGVRDSEAIDDFRRYLHHKFNAARVVFEKEQREQLIGLDLDTLLNDAPHSIVHEPITEAVRREATEGGGRSYYIEAPEGLDAEQLDLWVEVLRGAGRRATLL